MGMENCSPSGRSQAGVESELVKFTWERLSSSAPSDDDVQGLRRVCNVLDEHDLLTPYRPPAIVGSNGNVSYRLTPEGGFLVTGTQLASKRDIRGEDCVIVDRYESTGAAAAPGKAYYHGARLPSSESILHWYFYRKYREIGAVIHAHELTGLLYDSRSRLAWKGSEVVETSRAGQAGLIDLPRSVDEVLEDTRQFTVMKDHYAPWDKAHTGFVVFGVDLDRALDRVMDVHKALVDAAR